MKIEILPLLESGLQLAVDLLNLGYADYTVHIGFSLPGFLAMARSESIDLAASRVIHMDGEAVGIALIARRGWTSRLAGMCLAPAARGQGGGRAAMQQLLQEAVERGDHSMLLEVIESNTPAVRLYEGIGFHTERRLLSYAGEIPVTGGQGSDRIEEMDIREAAQWVSMYGLPNLPWQISSESLAQSGPPTRAFRRDDACLVISNPEAEMIGIRSLVVRPESRHQGQAARLLGAVADRYPGRKWLVPALCPEEAGGFFEKMGLLPDSLSQLQMRAEFDHPG